MQVINPSDVTDLQVRTVVRNRPSDDYAWWYCIVHEMPAHCSVSQDILNEISRRNHGADVEVVTDDNSVEVIAWLSKRRPNETVAYEVTGVTHDALLRARRTERRRALESTGPGSIIALARQWYKSSNEADLAAAVQEYEQILKETP